MDYAKEYKRNDDIVKEIALKYTEMLKDDNLDDKVFAAITGALYHLNQHEDTFVFGLSGPECGGISRCSQK